MPELLTVDYIVANRAALLTELHSRQGVLRDFVGLVVDDKATGIYVFGRPGTAKSYTVNEVLKTVSKAISPQRGHLTPMGLFELIADHPDEVIVLDDVTAVFDSDVALQILLSALESPSPATAPAPASCSYRRKDDVRRAPSVAASSASPTGSCTTMTCWGRSRAASTPSTTTRPTRSSARDAGHRRAGRLHGIASSRESGLRSPGSSSARCCGWDAASTCGCSSTRRCRIYQQWKDGETESDWRDLVTASIEQHLVAVRHAAGSRAEAGWKRNTPSCVRSCGST